MEAAIKKIVIDLGGKEISLTIDQAREMSRLLAQLISVHVPATVPYPIIIHEYHGWYGPHWVGDQTTWMSDDGRQFTYTAQNQALSLSL